MYTEKLISAYYRIAEIYRVSIRPHITKTFFAEHGLMEYVRHFSAAELNILSNIAPNVPAYPDLAKVASAREALRYPEALDRVGILAHTLGVMQVFEILAGAQANLPVLRDYLTRHGNPDIVEKGKGIITPFPNSLKWANSLES